MDRLLPLLYNGSGSKDQWTPSTVTRNLEWTRHGLRTRSRDAVLSPRHPSVPRPRVRTKPRLRETPRRPTSNSYLPFWSTCGNESYSTEGSIRLRVRAPSPVTPVHCVSRAPVCGPLGTYGTGMGSTRRGPQG